MRAHRVPALILGLLALASVSPIPGQDKKPADPPAPSIDELVADLGHPVFAVREKAQRELWARGEAAIPALEKAARGEDPEVTRRARELLDKFAWGIRPDTPPEVLKLLRQFQAGDRDPQKSAEVRKAAILELLRRGPRGVSVARAILGKNLPDEARAQVVAQITALLRREVPLRLFDGKLDDAAELIALHAGGTSPDGAADYAMFQILRDNLPAAITAAEAAVKSGKSAANQKLILVYLYRANADWEKARAAAADMPATPRVPSPVELLREDEGDWSTLADTIAFGGVNHPDAVRLTMLRLAGRQKAFEEAAQEVVKAANEYSGAQEIFNAVVALYANNRAEEATKILIERKQNLGLLAEVLIARLRYQDALTLLADDKALPFDEKLAFDLRRARVLMLVGRRDEAVQLFNTVAEGMRKSGVERSNSFAAINAIRSVLRAEVRTGLRDLAAEHAAEFLASGTFGRFEQSASGESAFEILFGQDATAAEPLFWALREKKIPGEAAGATMILTRDLLAGKAGKAAVDEALKALRDSTQKFQFSRSDTPLEPSDTWKIRKHLATAAVCRAAGRDADAEAAFKVAAESTSDAADISGARTWAFGVSDAHRPYVEWGDFLYDRERYHDAAARFLDGWKRFPDQPLLMFLSGKALVKAGDAKEGNRRIELAHWVALGQERVRGKFLDELNRRGEGTAAKREIDLVLRGCWFRDHYYGNVLNQVSQAAALVRDFATAEKSRQRSLLVILKTPNIYFVETSAYMTVPHDLLVHRARGRLAAGKVDEAVALAREVLAVTPGHTDIVSGMVPELERLGKKAEADELFGKAWSAYQQVLTDFPDSPSARHSLATLAANCRRELDKGLTYATAAVKSDPASRPFREALAEVYFRKGEREKALEVLTKLAEEDPRNRLYKRQLTRYRMGALDSPKPDRED